MKKVFAIARREVESYFSGPLAYVVTATVLALAGFFFVPGALAHGERDLTNWVGNVGIILVVLVPALTMRLLAEERRTGTLELLLTAPLRERDVVLGKYLGSLAFFAIILLLLSEYPITFLFLCRPQDPVPVYVGMLGLFLFGAFFLSVGLFFSSLTRSQGAAYFATFGLLLFLYLMSWMAQPGPGFWGQVLTYISLQRQMIDFARGVVDTRDLVFYATGIFFSLFLSMRMLAAVR